MTSLTNTEMYSKSLCSIDPSFNARLIIKLRLKAELCDKNVMGLPILAQCLSVPVQEWDKNMVGVNQDQLLSLQL